MLSELDRIGDQIFRRFGKRSNCRLQGDWFWGLSGKSYGKDMIAGGVWKVDSLIGHRPTDRSLSGVSEGPHDHLRLTLKIVNVTSAETSEIK